MEYAIFRVPDSLMQDADQIVRLDEQVFVVKNTQTGTLFHKKVVTLLNENGTENQLVLFYDKDTKINSLTANIYDAVGTHIRKIGSKEIKDEAALDGFSIYDDSRVKYVDVAYGSYPYTVEFTYEMTLGGIDFAVFPNWDIQSYNTAVQSGRFEINMPDNQQFHYRALNTNITAAEGKPSAGRKNWVWTVSGLPAVAWEPLAPAPSSVLPRILTSPDAFEIGGYRGSMASWADYGAFIYELYKGRDQLPDSVKADVQRVVAGAADTPAKISALYRYLQGKMRYVSVQMGIGGWQPFDAQYVAKNQYGDCKALSNYMKALLKEAGIEASLVLIKNGDLDYEVTPDFTTPQFNHAILYVPESGMWLECTSTDMPPNYIGASNAGRNVLLVTPQGGRLERTPAQGADFNTTANTTRIVIRADGTATLSQWSRTQGEPHDDIRYLSKHEPQEEHKKWLLKSIGLPAFQLDSLSLAAEKDAPTATLAYRATLGKTGSQTGKRWFIPLNPVNSFQDVPPVQTSRNLPVTLTTQMSQTDTIYLTFPTGYSLESYPTEPLGCRRSFGEYALRVVPTETGATVYRSLRLSAATLPKEDYNDCRNFFRDVAKYDAIKLVLKQND